MFKQVICIISILLIQSCATLSESETWPAELPPQTLFTDSCYRSGGCSTQDQTAEHLTWIKRFYYGSILYPIGWIEMTELTTSGLQNPKEKVDTRERLDALGLSIVLEWAKDNTTRLINSKLLSIWGKALQTSAERNEQIEFIGRIENDVENIFAGSLTHQEISSERYYPTEDYDNF